jgi:hypothetical protein
MKEKSPRKKPFWFEGESLKWMANFPRKTLIWLIYKYLREE